MRYAARIVVGDRAYDDRGSTFAQLFAPAPGAANPVFFDESFASDLTEPTLVCEKYKDKKDGKEDRCKEPK